MTILSYLAGKMGVAMGLGVIPQAYKIFKRKSAKDISGSMYIILTIGMFIWILYGLETGDKPVIIAYSTGFLGYLSVLVGWFLYK